MAKLDYQGGLLGQFADPQNMGLLSAAAAILDRSGPSTRPSSLGQILGGGLLAGVQGMQSAQDRQRESRMYDLRLKQFEDQQADQQKVRDFYGNLSQFMPSQGVQALGAGAKLGDIGPTVTNAARIDQMPKQGFDSNAMYQAMLNSGSPTLAATGLQGLSKEDESVVVGEGGALVNKRNGAQLFNNPKQEKPLEIERMLDAAGITDPAMRARFMMQAITKQTTHAPGTNVVLPKIEVKTGESIAGQVGPILKGTRDQAIAGVKLVDSSRRVLDAAESGNLYAGPTATLRLRGAQIADTLGIGGKDTAEKIANTRAVVRGMAEQAVAARSQLGGQAQISNAEQELINRATSGDITDLTIPEITQIAQLNDRLGRQMYEGHQMYLNQMSQNPNLQGLTGFYSVPEMPAPRTQGSKVRRYNPASGRIE